MEKRARVTNVLCYVKAEKSKYNPQYRTDTPCLHINIKKFQKGKKQKKNNDVAGSKVTNMQISQRAPLNKFGTAIFDFAHAASRNTLTFQLV